MKFVLDIAKNKPVIKSVQQVLLRSKIHSNHILNPKVGDSGGIPEMVLLNEEPGQFDKENINFPKGMSNNC